VSATSLRRKTQHSERGGERNHESGRHVDEAAVMALTGEGSAAEGSVAVLS